MYPFSLCTDKPIRIQIDISVCIFKSRTSEAGPAKPSSARSWAPTDSEAVRAAPDGLPATETLDGSPVVAVSSAAAAVVFAEGL